MPGEMIWAAGLLRDIHLSIGEIAARTGYTNSKNFSRAFHNYYHMTPMQYRKKGEPDIEVIQNDELIYETGDRGRRTNIRDSLSQLFPWEELGIQVVFLAANAGKCWTTWK